MYLHGSEGPRDEYHTKEEAERICREKNLGLIEEIKLNLSNCEYW